MGDDQELSLYYKLELDEVVVLQIQDINSIIAPQYLPAFSHSLSLLEMLSIVSKTLDTEHYSKYIW